MTTDLSNASEEGIDFGDKHVLNLLENSHKTFESGDRSALFTVITLCARYQAVIPEWAANEILRIEQSIKNGEVKDFNVTFGWTSENLASRKKKAKLEKHTNEVLAMMQKFRVNEGYSLNADELLQEVADKLKISRRVVEDIYKEHGQFIKDLPRKCPEIGATYSFVSIEIPRPRRHGRPILKD